jgi:SGS domain
MASSRSLYTLHLFPFIQYAAMFMFFLALLQEMEKTGDLEFGDPLSNFFKKIFSQGDEEQRRAMQKSFVVRMVVALQREGRKSD